MPAMRNLLCTDPKQHEYARPPRPVARARIPRFLNDVRIRKKERYECKGLHARSTITSMVSGTGRARQPIKSTRQSNRGYRTIIFHLKGAWRSIICYALAVVQEPVCYDAELPTCGADVYSARRALPAINGNKADRWRSHELRGSTYRISSTGLATFFE